MRLDASGGTTELPGRMSIGGLQNGANDKKIGKQGEG